VWISLAGYISFDHRVLRTASKKRMWKRIEETKGKDETVASYLGLLGHGNAWGLEEQVKGLLMPNKP
jgi:hypothetical protein